MKAKRALALDGIKPEPEPPQPKTRRLRTRTLPGHSAVSVEVSVLPSISTMNFANYTSAALELSAWSCVGYSSISCVDDDDSESK